MQSSARVNRSRRTATEWFSVDVGVEGPQQKIDKSPPSEPICCDPCASLPELRCETTTVQRIGVPRKLLISLETLPFLYRLAKKSNREICILLVIFLIYESIY